ncbi:MAG: type IV secretory system conjugative DNA transfer family protein [Caulobacteraceae bacterium]
MTTTNRLAMFAAITFGSALAAMWVMTYHRAGVPGFYVPWAWFGWYKAYARVRPWDYLGDAGLGLSLFLAPVIVLLFVLKYTAPAVALRAFGLKAWASSTDIARAKLVPKGGDFSGRVFGTFNGKMLVYKGNEPALVVGATRSGKGAGHVVPTLLAWAESAFIYDRKGELWEITVDRRKKISHCIKFDPTDPHTIRWNPLFEIRIGRMEIADIQNVVGILVDPLGQKAGNLNFWDQSAINFFTAIILHVLYTEDDDKKHLAEVRRKLINLEPTLLAMLNTAHRYRPDAYADDGFARDENGEKIPEPHPEVILGAQAFALMDDRVKANVLATMQGSLSLWAEPDDDVTGFF